MSDDDDIAIVAFTDRNGRLIFENGYGHHTPRRSHTSHPRRRRLITQLQIMRPPTPPPELIVPDPREEFIDISDDEMAELIAQNFDEDFIDQGVIEPPAAPPPPPVIPRPQASNYGPRQAVRRFAHACQYLFRTAFGFLANLRGFVTRHEIQIMNNEVRNRNAATEIVGNRQLINSNTSRLAVVEQQVRTLVEAQENSN